jgi:integrase
MRANEARTLRWSQVNFEVAEIAVGKDAKTEAGKGRRIPMTAELKAVLAHHEAWCASKLGPTRPDWFVFPFCRTKRPVDPLRPVTSLKKAWESVRAVASVECRLHDFRHSFCTKLAEAGVPESTMLDMMGHVSTSMLRHYSHIRAKARREAIDALEARQKSIAIATKVATTEATAPRPQTVTH